MQTLFESTGENPEKYGLPVLDDKRKSSCSISNATLGPCSRKGRFLLPNPIPLH